MTTAFTEFDFLCGPGGLVALLIVFVLMTCLGIFAMMLYGLLTTRGQKSAATPRTEQAVGKHATVYIHIPGGKSGTGKIQVNLLSGTTEYLAMTSGKELPTGSEVLVVDVITPTTVEVQPAAGPGKERR